jgi:polysaccharide export outer membrane protein
MHARILGTSMRLNRARIALILVVLSLFSATAFSQSLFQIQSPQQQQQQQQQQLQQQSSPGCVPVPGGPPCPPTIPTASDYSRGVGSQPSAVMPGSGIPSITGSQTPRPPQPESRPPTTPGSAESLLIPPPSPLLPGVAPQFEVQPRNPAQQQVLPQQQPGAGQQPGFGQQPAYIQQPDPATGLEWQLVPRQKPAIVNQPGLAPRVSTPGQQAPVTNEFQEFVAQSLGRYLPLFGYSLFAGTPSTFAPVDNVPVTPDYLIGPGDEIHIRAWGQVDIDYRAVVDRNGVINIPRVGNINVTGIRYHDLNNYLRTAIGRVFRNFELSATLGQLRSIQIFIVGHAKQPGSYTVSSLSTLVNAVFFSGGPSLKGSMREIQLKRGSKTVTTLDLYDLLLKGDKSKDVQLMTGDVIYFPPVGPLAAVSGSVNEPAIYELKSKSTLNDLIHLAGGLSTTAEGRRATVERIEDRRARKVDEFTLDTSGLARELKDGDMVRIYALSPKFDNAITLRGAVANPGRYPFRDGIRVSDILPNREALVVPDYWARQNRVQDVLVLGQQRLRIEVTRNYDEINWDYAVIERLSYDTLTPQLIPFHLGRAIVDGDQTNNVQLKPGDVVTIFSKADIQVPIAKQTKFVRLEGEVAAPGIYQVLPGETLRQLITRIGGATPNAYLYGAEFTRETTREIQQRRLKEAIDFLEREIQRAFAASAASRDPTEAGNLRLRVEGQQKLVENLRQIRASGRIVLELQPDRADVRDLPDITLEDGDRLLVPSKPNTVIVMGSVYNQNAFLYRPDGRVPDYISRAAPTRGADMGGTYVIRADGTVVSSRQSGFFSAGLDGRLMPGDTIVVPEDLDKFSFTKELKEWAAIFYQFALGAAAVKILRD